MRKSRQQALPFPNGWGGKRKGAGRPPGPRRQTSHRARPEHSFRHPVHVTLRSAFRPLRTRFVFPTLERAIAEANQRHGHAFRVVHFSVQADHLHLLVEASDKHTLSAGMKGLAVRIARRVNGLVFRRGRFWADRWHGRALTSPRATRHALAYVLGNFRKHDPRARVTIDRFSSAPLFPGFREYQGRTPADGRPELADRKTHPPWSKGAGREAMTIVLPPSTWLLRAGWQKAGGLSVYDGPTTLQSKDGHPPPG
jgi:REP element-mobilizing transposase RayT